ncbi:hypothetical protein F542_7440 [Bibersteinia trehalosi USDA-ARS-USMARC-188]|uniref:Uncharacterized protein n=3 Tax=Bibersteinia trehalosi TaxID=47735 RepID=W0R6J1_BIBTR|nr:hypothetical protein WQG_14620 [Bibersteinia trehalosi USDA-ARS-USMARC-192]AHG81462.1 hypothetical protein F542_7440 [Bibersteinia trehalosi USDA-ARS-USMARC-188]AHG83730.1 hypothetical protein F543_8660 [Bibersteinia trehalosi USDA-ARS-USMARC-189]AHG86724.1 hypothetical protein F544_14960 [Bibersteinia trehalosi USDA-ARS-USMARC-190]
MLNKNSRNYTIRAAFTKVTIKNQAVLFCKNFTNLHRLQAATI